MQSVYHILVLIICCEYTAALYYDVNIPDSRGDVGEPLFLTEFIEKGSIAEAQEKARVRHPALGEIESYSGLITIDKTYNSNTFFWFFPSKSNPKDDPLILWFIGGPGVSTLGAVFTLNGPFVITSENILLYRNYSITGNHSVIYIDNPIGTGFSFTDNDKGYARNQEDIAQHVISFLLQFFQLFPQYQRNDFYIGGDSYGAKFVISSSNAVKKFNDKNQFNINLQGLIIGNGFMNNDYQKRYSDFFYTIGLIDEKVRNVLKVLEMNDELGVTEETTELLKKLIGYNYFYNIVGDQFNYENYGLDWISSADFRRAVHVGKVVLNFRSDTVKHYLKEDNPNLIKQLLEENLEYNYKVLIYHGQLDMFLPYSSSVNFYLALNWSGAELYKECERKQWWVDGELAGYIKVAGNFHEVLVRNSGHVTFFEQPKWTCELLTQFTHQKADNYTNTTPLILLILFFLTLILSKYY